MIFSIKVRSVCLQFEADFDSHNTGKRVTMCVYCTRSHVCPYHSIVTLCAYAQQGYAFGCVGLCSYVCTYIYVCQQKNRLFFPHSLLSLQCSFEKEEPTVIEPYNNKSVCVCTYVRIYVCQQKTYSVENFKNF